MFVILDLDKILELINNFEGSKNEKQLLNDLKEICHEEMMYTESGRNNNNKENKGFMKKPSAAIVGGEMELIPKKKELDLIKVSEEPENQQEPEEYYQSTSSPQEDATKDQEVK